MDREVFIKQINYVLQIKQSNNKSAKIDFNEVNKRLLLGWYVNSVQKKDI